MEPGEGIEPSTSSLPWRRSTTELPRRVVPGTGFEPVKAYANRFTVCSIWPLWYPGMEPPVGLEPTTYPLQEDCSTTELRWRHLAV